MYHVRDENGRGSILPLHPISELPFGDSYKGTEDSSISNMFLRSFRCSQMDERRFNASGNR